jgi:hypothetical protein
MRISQLSQPLHRLSPQVPSLGRPLPSPGRPLGTFAGFTAHALLGHKIVDKSKKYAVPGAPPSLVRRFDCKYCDKLFLTSPALTSHCKSKHKVVLAEEAKSRSPSMFFSGGRSASLVDLTASPSASSRLETPTTSRSPSVKHEALFLGSRSASEVDLTSSPSPSARHPSPPAVKRERKSSPSSAPGDAGFDSEATQEYPGSDGDDGSASDNDCVLAIADHPVSPRSVSFYECAEALGLPFDQPPPGDLTQHFGACYPMSRVRPEILPSRHWWWARRANLAQRRRDATVDEAEARGPRGVLFADPSTPLFERAGLTDGPHLNQQWASLLRTQREASTFYEGVWIELDAELFGAVTVRGVLCDRLTCRVLY